MQKLLIALAGASALFLAGCQSAPVKSEPARAAISDDAAKALAQAEADVKQAKAKDALWTTAAEALKEAQEAAKKGDSATVIKEAKMASDQAKLGIGQLSYPITH